MINLFVLILQSKSVIVINMKVPTSAFVAASGAATSEPPANRSGIMERTLAIEPSLSSSNRTSKRTISSSSSSSTASDSYCVSLAVGPLWWS